MLLGGGGNQPSNIFILYAFVGQNNISFVEMALHYAKRVKGSQATLLSNPRVYYI